MDSEELHPPKESHDEKGHGAKESSNLSAKKIFQAIVT